MPGVYYTNKPIYSHPANVAQVSNLPYRGLPVCNQKLNPTTHDLNAMAVRCPFSLGLRTRQRLAAQHCQHSVKMRDRLVPPTLNPQHAFLSSFTPSRHRSKPKRDKMRHFQKHTKLSRCAAGTYDDHPPPCPIFKCGANSVGIRTRSSDTNWL
jgi:hypothetical protein